MNRKQRRRREWLGKRIAELATGPRTPEAMAEIRACADELETMRVAEQPSPPLELPAAGEFVMRPRARPAGETPEQKQARLLRNFHAQRSGMAAKIYNPERAAARVERVRDGREHVSALARDRFNPWR